MDRLGKLQEGSYSGVLVALLFLYSAETGIKQSMVIYPCWLDRKRDLSIGYYPRVASASG